MKQAYMKIKETYRNIIGLALAIMAPAFIFSCIREDLEDCRIFLEFIYDYNMEYKDCFNPEVGTVDIFVFDAQGKFLLTRHYFREELIGGNKIDLGSFLPLGEYNILSTGGLSDDFHISDATGNDLIPGVTTIEEVRIALQHVSTEISHEFPAFWLGTEISVKHRKSETAWPVSLVKETNRFHITFIRTNDEIDSRANSETSYTVEIVLPEDAVYDAHNKPLQREELVYKPYLLKADRDSVTLSTAEINTMRLFDNDENPSHLIIRNSKSGEKLWDYDLIDLLTYLKPNHKPDGAELTMQEFLDRKSEWDITLCLKEEDGTGGTEGFTGVGILVNNWIIWINDIGI